VHIVGVHRLRFPSDHRARFDAMQKNSDVIRTRSARIAVPVLVAVLALSCAGCITTGSSGTAAADGRAANAAAKPAAPTPASPMLGSGY
jgi:hypothetical protein